MSNHHSDEPVPATCPMLVVPNASHPGQWRHIMNVRPAVRTTHFATNTAVVPVRPDAAAFLKIKAATSATNLEAIPSLIGLTSMQDEEAKDDFVNDAEKSLAATTEAGPSTASKPTANGWESRQQIPSLGALLTQLQRLTDLQEQQHRAQLQAYEEMAKQLQACQQTQGVHVQWMEAITQQSECKHDGPIIRLTFCGTNCIHRTVEPKSVKPSLVVKKPNCSDRKKCPWCRSMEHSGGKKSCPFAHHLIRRQAAIVLASLAEQRGGLFRETADTVVKEYKELEGEREREMEKKQKADE
jgi:hypothetical protein